MYMRPWIFLATPEFVNDGSMSEKPPGEDKLEIYRKKFAAGFELQKKELEDPERGPTVRQVRAVLSAANKNYNEDGSFYNELSTFQASFIEHFSRTEAKRYRLFHYLIGSTPPIEADLFDGEGEWSIAGKTHDLAEKYHIHIEKV